MLEYLEAYCTVNEIEDAEALVAAGQVVVDYEDLDLINLARKGSILVMFKKYLTGQLTLEQFINNGEELNDELEVIHQADILFEQLYRREAPGYVLQRMRLDDMLWANSLFVFEQHIWDTYPQQEILLGAIEERQSVLVLI